MAELVPAPFCDLVTRLYAEPRVQESLFGLPKKKWYVPQAGDPDLSVTFHEQIAGNASLGIFPVPNIIGNETFSFLGVDFPTAVVARVRIISGNQPLGPGNTTGDTVVMDDFLYAEPVSAIPEPATAALALLALAALPAQVLRRRRA